MTKEIKCVVKNQKTKDGSREFKVYFLVDKEGKLQKCKFTKAVTNVPSETCFIVVDTANLSHQKNTEYPCWWVRKIEEIKPYVKEQVEETLPF